MSAECYADSLWEMVDRIHQKHTDNVSVGLCCRSVAKVVQFEIFDSSRRSQSRVCLTGILRTFAVDICNYTLNAACVQSLLDLTKN